MVCVFDADDREGETDLFILAEHATPTAVARLRREAGGLVFAAVDPMLATKLDLPLLEQLHEEAAVDHPVLGRLLPKRLPYDTRSSFGITINHRDTFTGITDEDRSLTLQRLGLFVRDLPGLDVHEARERFVQEFRSPGHVHVCHGAERGLDERRGHTELAVALARIAGVPAAVVGAEMLAEGPALPRSEAEAYARDHDIPFVTGEDLAVAWRTMVAAARATSVPA